MEIEEEAKDDNDVAGHEANHDNNDMNANQGIESMLGRIVMYIWRSTSSKVYYRCRGREAIQVFQMLPKS